VSRHTRAKRESTEEHLDVLEDKHLMPVGRNVERTTQVCRAPGGPPSDNRTTLLP